VLTYPGKRIFDLVLVAGLGPLLVPIAAIVALCLWLSEGAVLFHQVRAGLLERPLTLWKFRSMREARDANGAPLADDLRLTQLGRFIRQTSLDEIPQLWNVLKGEMSVVGPRPLPIEYLRRYSPTQAARHRVLPGITGWAQVKGRNALTWEEKFALDVWYVEHVSFLLDVKILFMTIFAVVKRCGISAPGHATMTEFRGANVEQ
jgi:lipopolysaccharide/colanic/teichoic acid biosynthesis glycosyltransferase